jgi:hypothetical protein
MIISSRQNSEENSAQGSALEDIYKHRSVKEQTLVKDTVGHFLIVWGRAQCK